MSSNKLFVQEFRTNDLKDHSGSQIEFGKAWLDFFEIEDSQKDANINLVFKSLDINHEKFNNKEIELKLSAVTARGDRKTYADGSESGQSALKEFFLYDLHLNKDSNSGDFFAIYKATEFNYFLYYIPKLLYVNFIKFFESINPTVTIKKNTDASIENSHLLQQIFYGAPGTGKSHEVKKITGELLENGEDRDLPNVFRTTFHPDTDYASFVGCYKPTMKSTSKEEKTLTGKDEEIVYEFVPQTFTDAYVYAYNNPTEPTYLIIEEINRGNCAQIFGDLFQLLDRNNGVSEYRIKADKDLAKFLNEGKEKDGKEVLINKDGIKDGKLCLPANLNILATMNTSDQSLFPIDSAFKRRWDWEYIKITEGKDEKTEQPLGWKILVCDKEEDRVRLYDWWRFLQLINKKIFDATHSADKQMGYFFAKANEVFNGEKVGKIIKGGDFESSPSESLKMKFVSAETFVNKVLFYLWTDVLKDNEYDEIASLMKDGDMDLSFPDFFDESGKEISPAAVRAFLDKVMEEEDIICDVAEWKVDINDNNINRASFKPKSVIFKITDIISNKEKLYLRAKGWWRMAEKRANITETEYAYVYSTPLKKITACYKITEWNKNQEGRFGFEGDAVDNDAMIGQPVESIAHVRGQVVFYSK